jgi:ABC-type antimicrobial peptide transport system permease subunit
MEPNKLEKQLREKLSSREIQPSAQAWDRLDAMLSESEERKTRRPFGFLFIAASITVLLTVGMLFFTQNGPEIQPKNEVVSSETKDTIQKKVNEISTPRVENIQEVVSNQPTTDNRQPTTNNQRVSISTREQSSNGRSNQKSAIKNQKSSNQNTLINRDKEIEYLINSSDIALKDLPKIRTGSQVISGTNKEVISDEELLAGLENLAKQPANKKSNVKVDAKNLLSQVDGELELTFREKVIKKVSKKYKEVKVAIANRNIQE